MKFSSSLNLAPQQRQILCGILGGLVLSLPGISLAQGSHFWNSAPSPAVTQKKEISRSASNVSSNRDEVSYDELVNEYQTKMRTAKPKPPVTVRQKSMEFGFANSMATYNYKGRNNDITQTGFAIYYRHELQPLIGYSIGYKNFMRKSMRSNGTDIDVSANQFQGTGMVITPLQEKLDLRMEAGIAPRFIHYDETGRSSDKLSTNGIVGIAGVFKPTDSLLLSFAPEMRLPLFGDDLERTSYDINFLIGAQF